jgi:hypothetical protein
MFHKAKTENERQEIFDKYLLNILKQKKVIKKNQRIIDKTKFGFDPSIAENRAKGAFNSYKDSLVIKLFLIEQIYTRLKINKNMAVNFVNKLDGNQLLILSKVINEFITDIQSKYFSINDYILRSSFDEFQANYNVIQQQEQNKQIVKENQEVEGDILQQNIPAGSLKELEEPNTPPPVYTETNETEGAEEQKSGDDKEDKLMIEFLKNTVFKIKGQSGRGQGAIDVKKILYGESQANNANLLKSLELTNDQINEKFRVDVLTRMKDEPFEKKKDLRIFLKNSIIDAFLYSTIIKENVKFKNVDLFEPYRIQKVEGTGARKKRGKMLFVRGGGFSNPPLEKPKIEHYIPLGKYLAHKTKLIGGKSQIRSYNNNQVFNLKSQNITSNVRDILMKLNRKETINFKDVDKLDSEEKNQLYTLGKKLHITELFDIPSTLKTQEDKLKDEFTKLRGSLVAGNNSPELFKKIKIIMLKMKNNKLISLQEYNEILNILLETEI